MKNQKLLPAYSQPPTALNAIVFEDDLQLLPKTDNPGGLTIIPLETYAPSRIE